MHIVNSPIKDPVLQMRLKKQLSGGSVPHLLQIRTSEQRLDAQGSHHMNKHTYSTYMLIPKQMVLRDELPLAVD